MTFAEIQEEIVNRIRALNMPIEAHAENMGDVSARVTEAIKSVGICAVAATPQWTPESSASKHIVGVCRVVVAVGEYPAINRAKEAQYVTALEAAEQIAWHLNLAVIDGATLVVDSAGISMQEEERGIIVARVAFRLQHVLGS